MVWIVPCKLQSVRPARTANRLCRVAAAAPRSTDDSQRTHCACARGIDAQTRMRGAGAHTGMPAQNTAADSFRETVPSQLADLFTEFVSQTPQPQIILGTQSASRRAVVNELAERFDFKYSSITADIDEKAIRRPEPSELVRVLAHAKAKAIIGKLQDSGSFIAPGLLVTCDQVVVWNGELREKPESAEEARRFIKSYALAPAKTIGACVCVCLDTGVYYEDIDVNKIFMSGIPDHVIDELIQEGQIFSCSGGLMIEHPLVQPFIDKIEGTTEGVMGLSRTAFMRVLLQTLDKSASSVAV
eukprot:jgi/Ulvmu1/3359/UM156_0016.1